MKKFKRGLVMALALSLALGTLAGCKGDTKDSGTSPSPSASSSPSASASASPSATGELTTEERNASKEKVKLTMVLCDSGLSCPDGVDINNNEWTTMLEKLANVDLEINQPDYKEYDQKLQLQLAGGDLPDIVHTIGTSTTTASTAGAEGAFVELSELYKNSYNVKKLISEEQMSWVTEPTDGKNYRIPMSGALADKGCWLLARWDLVEKYNNGKWPETVPEWVSLMEKLKGELPADSTILSNRNIKADYALAYGGRVIYQMYGLMGQGGGNMVWDYDNQKLQNEFLTPEYKAATKLMKELYEKGILDPEFATTEKWFDNKKSKNVLMEVNDSSQVGRTMSKKEDGTPSGEIWRMAGELKEWPAETRYPEVAYGVRSNNVIGHGLYISSKCKTPERAFDVLEALASDEMIDMSVWGTEGYSYKMVGDERVPIPEVRDANAAGAKYFNWQRQFLIISGFNAWVPFNDAVARVAMEELLGKEAGDKLVDEQIASFQDVMAKSDLVGISPGSLPGFIASDNATRKTAESKASMSTTTINYILGKITDAELDAAIVQWEKDYGFIADEQTQYINSYDKADAEKRGIQYTLK